MLQRFDESQHPRDEHGRWTDGGSSDDASSGTSTGGRPEGAKHPGEGYSKDAYEHNGVIYTKDVHDAQRALYENRKVELDQPRKVSVLLQELGKTAKEMIAKGEKAPQYNLCNVTVTGTNLFCADTKGIPRIKMPQLDDKQTQDFVAYLKNKYPVKDESQYASHLRATQNELNGAKVAGVAERMRGEPNNQSGRLVVSNDDYILDGHHRWAAKVGLDAEDGNLSNDTKMNITRVNIPITKLLEEAETFTGGKGHKPATETTTSRIARRQAMPMKPGKDESESDFMGRCVPEMTSGDRPQEQAVAACLSIWRDANPTKGTRRTVEQIIARAKAVFAKQDAPDPEDDESRDDFIDRCVGELQDEDDSLDDDAAEEMCIVAWEQRRARAMVHKMRADAVEGKEFILSDETPDRMGEIIQADGWDLQNFKKNPIALFNHRADFVVGRWRDLKTAKGELRGHLELAPEGTSPRIDEIRRLVEAGILKAVSVGFKPIKSQPMREEDRSLFAPQRYLKQELVETSLVSIPANPNALAVAKSLKISSATLDLVFAEQGNRDGLVQRGLIGGHAETRKRTTIMSSLSQRIADAQARKVDLLDRLEKHLATIDDNNVTEEQMAATRELNKQLKQTDDALELLMESEKRLAGTTTGDGKGTTTTVVKRDPTSPAVILKRSKDLKPLDYLVRAGVVTYLSKLTQRMPDDICKNYTPYNDEETRAFVDWNVRAATNPALTTVTGWAAELVQTTYADFMSLLLPMSVYPRLAAKGLSLNFGRTGKISIPTRSATPTIAGSFVGEGLPIPVRQGAFTAIPLTPKKMAVITTWSREIDEHSIPAIEGLLRQAIQEDTAVSLDSILLDTNVATAVRPAGILASVGATAATAGGGLAAVIGDIKALVGALTTSTKGNLRAPVWLMNPTDVLSAGLASAANTGIFPFKDETAAGRLANLPIIDSGTVPAKTVILIDAADFVSAGAQGPRFEVSDQATLHEEDTSPAPIVGGSPATTAAPVRSLWQTDSLALRLILPMNWAIRRTGVVAWTQNVTW